MINEVNTIVYASDLGEGSRPAFRIAVQEAIKHEAQIIFLNVIAPMSDLTEATIELYLSKTAKKKQVQKLLDATKARIEQRIEDFLHSELSSGVCLPVKPEIAVRVGVADKVILQVAKQCNAQMIVMGDRESNAMSRMFLGSTALKVLNASHIPVLIVPLPGTK